MIPEPELFMGKLVITWLLIGWGLFMLSFTKIPDIIQSALLYLWSTAFIIGVLYFTWFVY